MAKVPLIKNFRTTHERVEKFLSPIYFKDVNLYGKLIKDQKKASIKHFLKVTVPHEPETISNALLSPPQLSVNEVINSSATDWEDVQQGFSFGPTWSLHWFRVEFTLPNDWSMDEAFFYWDSGTEALIYHQNGNILQGLNSCHKRRWISFKDFQNEINNECSSSSIVLFIQVTSSDLFGAGKDGMINPPDQTKTFSINSCEIQLRNKLALELFQQLNVLYDFAEKMETGTVKYEALHAANQAINLALTHTEDDYQKALAVTKDFFSTIKCGNYRGRHVTVAMGHCHIDTAWLWRYDETRRKCARSWSSALSLMKKYPQMKFVCSQAQQMEWLKQDYPQLFQDLLEKFKTKQFIPVGGSWVEMDANIPSCESFIRQFYYGQEFFEENFGQVCEEFWLPDTFGYSAQLPQIMKLFGIERFVTQKLSWSLVNKFPHHTFYWRGIDGSKVLTHFPPGDSYNMDVKVEELLKTEKNHQDKGRSNRSMYLFGYGDGGQGPTEEMVQRIDLFSDCAGLPKVEWGSPTDYFEHVENNDAENLCTWSGELYLELHNGTYTTHRQLKQLNLSSELHLVSVELLEALVFVKGKSKKSEILKPSDLPTIKQLWKWCLLNQFHDVLPGSSIESACDDAYFLYKDILKNCANYQNHFLQQMEQFDKVDQLVDHKEVLNHILVNPTIWPLTYRVDVNGLSKHITIPPLGFSNCLSTDPTLSSPSSKVTYVRDSFHRVENQHFTLCICDSGTICSFKVKNQPEPFNECVSNPIQLTVYDDVPLFWDAWDVIDYNWETRLSLTDPKSLFNVSQPCTVTKMDEFTCQLTTTFTHQENGTEIILTIQVDSLLPYVIADIHVTKWEMTHKLLRLEWPTSLRAGTTLNQNGFYEIQGGFVCRPTHTNTSWDWAKHEVCSHRWMALEECHRGMALLKEATYGGSIRDNIFHVSLLRSSKAPDATADCKRAPHHIRLGFYPFSGDLHSANVSTHAHQLAWTALAIETSIKTKPAALLTSSPVFHGSLIQNVSKTLQNVEVLAVKLSEKLSNVILIRLVDTSGGPHVAVLDLNFIARRASRVNCYTEKDLETTKDLFPVKLLENGRQIEIPLKNFEIITVAFWI